ncbi:hypothetical protein RDWZM_006246 [Blomia tropicalis]|uniref:Uncharacterized protein n=1 Tax=Blomia tropicalis TaxID=40697 RepID=A0A9Q0RN47_BLOTA|nr:hypothetical protein RDWZM_006246 [Blomia tropicalis]
MNILNLNSMINLGYEFDHKQSLIRTAINSQPIESILSHSISRYLNSNDSTISSQHLLTIFNKFNSNITENELLLLISEMQEFDDQLTQQISNYSQMQNYTFESISLKELNRITNHQFDWIRLLNETLRQSMRSLIKLLENNDELSRIDDDELIAKCEHIFQLIHQKKFDSSKLKSNLVKYIDHSHLAQLDQARTFKITFYDENTNVTIQNRDLFNYVENLSNGPLRETYTSLQQSLLESNTTEMALWKQCIKMTKDQHSVSIAHRYIQRHIPVAMKDRSTEIIANVKKAFDDFLLNNVWIDEETRVKSREKLNTIQVIVGYPDWLNIQYGWLLLSNEHNVNDESLLEMSINKSTFGFSWTFLLAKLARSSKTIDSCWFYHQLGDFDSNPTHLVAYQILWFPFIFLLSSFNLYSHGSILAHEYATIGTMAAHEFAHGFDHTNPDKTFIWYNRWWAQTDQEQFLHRAQCFIEQYSNITEPIGNITLFGERTNQEDIADNVGIRVTYHALSQVLRTRNQRSRTMVEQQFFKQYATQWCTKYDPQLIEYLIAEDNHSPSKYRVNVPLANFETFSKIFNCNSTSKMNPQTKCSFW